MKQRVLCNACGYATRMTYLIHVLENKENNRPGVGNGGLYKIALAVKHSRNHFIWRNFFSLLSTLINILFWCCLVPAWDTFYLAADSIPSALQKCQTPRFVIHQHVAQSEVQVQTGWGQDCLPHDACTSYTPCHPLGSQLENSDTSALPTSGSKRQSPRHTATRRAKSIALELDVDRG